MYVFRFVGVVFVGVFLNFFGLFVYLLFFIYFHLKKVNIMDFFL